MSSIKETYGIVNINQSKLAEALSVTPQYISMIFSGKRKATEIRKRIISLIEVDIASFTFKFSKAA